MGNDRDSSSVFEAANVTKRYKHFVALNNLNMELCRGKIYGFIGENGAGKTTTIRIMAGLSRPSGGTISLFGKSDEKGLQEGRKKTGFLIESPAVYESMTGLQNIEIQCFLRQIDYNSWAKKTMNLVGLKVEDRRTVRHYSLGMRQRLGLAIALLGKPELLVLDEPINGLDPAGVHEMRFMLEELNRDFGITMLISSHILAEPSQTATDYIFLHNGKIIDKFSKDEFSLRRKRVFNIVTDDQSAAKLFLSSQYPRAEIARDDEGAIKLSGNMGIGVGEMTKTLVDGGFEIDSLSCKDESLEDYFLKKTRGDNEPNHSF